MAFAEHMDSFITSKSVLRRRKHPASQPRIYTALDQAVILFHHIIQILALPQYTRLQQRPVMLLRVNGRKIGSVTVHGDHPGVGCVCRAQHFPEKARRRFSSTGRTQHKSTHLALGIHGLV
jgi:hypothetical protein